MTNLPAGFDTVYRDIPHGCRPLRRYAGISTTFRRISMCQERLCGRIMCDVFIRIKLVCLVTHVLMLPYDFAMCQAFFLSNRGLKLLPAKTFDGVIIDHSHGLHEGIDDGRAYELEATPGKLLGHLPRKRGLGRDLPDGAEIIELGLAVEYVGKGAAEDAESFLVGVNRQRSLLAEIVRANIIEAHNVIGVPVSQEDGVQAFDAGAQALLTKIRSGVNDYVLAIAREEQGRAQPVVMRILRTAHGAMACERGNAHRRAVAVTGQRRPAGSIRPVGDSHLGDAEPLDGDRRPQVFARGEGGLLVERELGDESFDVRQKAKTELKEMGVLVVRMLRQVVNDSDQEVQQNARDVRFLDV